MVKKITSNPTLFEGYNKLQEEMVYIEDAIYSKVIGSNVCITCSRLDYMSQDSCGSILCCI